jgi:cupin superfamily acireductone dioxygenase involved in methionine salvage
MKNKLINSIKISMKPFLNENQIVKLNNTLINELEEFEVYKKDKNLSISESKENYDLLNSFLSEKRLKGVLLEQFTIIKQPL